ncbi:hypothetical protein QG37_00058 [Candidozyma auris]|nr:hypothetical protein QG37_00058 [[Candida] auris]
MLKISSKLVARIYGSRMKKEDTLQASLWTSKANHALKQKIKPVEGSKTVKLAL